MHPLRRAWIDHREQQPRARTLDVAQALGVSEGALLASRVGEDATRLRPSWTELIEGLKTVGRVLCLTRNTHIVHERRGCFVDVRADGPVGGVFGPDIDLRLFMSRWGAAFTAPVETRTGALDSLQIFDQHGVAALKVYREPDSDSEAWHTLVVALSAPEQTAGWTPPPAPQPEAAQPDRAIDVDGLRSAWDALQDTHDFFRLLRTHGAAREQALRLAGAPRAIPLALDALAALLNALSQAELPCMVFVANSGCVQIHSGPVRRIATLGGWLNVLDSDFNLHIHSEGVAEVWQVRKPTRNGLVTSLEAYDAQGELLLQIFGKRTEGHPQSPAWHALLDQISSAHPRTAPSEA